MKLYFTPLNHFKRYPLDMMLANLFLENLMRCQHEQNKTSLRNYRQKSKFKIFLYFKRNIHFWLNCLFNSSSATLPSAYSNYKHNNFINWRHMDNPVIFFYPRHNN